MGRAAKSGSCEGVIEGPSSRKLFLKRRRVREFETSEEDEEEEEEEEGQENKEGEHEEAGANDGSISVTLTDHQVLDCPICYEPLSNPVFQCNNGHIVCSSCSIKLMNNCPSCQLPIGHGCTKAIEKVWNQSK